MSSRCLLLFLLLSIAARADLKWTATTVATVGAPYGAPATAQFTFTNTGSYPVKVTGTRTSCGCTAAVADAKTIAPGETGKIVVSFKTLNRNGLYEEPIVIDTNDPATPRTTLTLRVLVRDALTLEPTFLYWQANEALAPKVIKITVTDGFHVKDIGVACPNGDVQFRLDTIKPGVEYKLTVTPKIAHLKAVISVTPHTDGRDLRTMTARVRAS